MTNLVLLGIYANQWYVAKSLPSTTPERTDDMAILQKKIKKGVLKPLVLGVVHLKFGIMAYVSNQIYIIVTHTHTTHTRALFSDRVSFLFTLFRSFLSCLCLVVIVVASI